jgi:hypothetical protein
MSKVPIKLQVEKMNNEKFKEDDFKNSLEIKRKIQDLKKEFLRYTKNRISVMYNILSEIVKLKKIANKRYAPRSLEWETDLNLNASQIRYIFSYEHFTDYGKKLVSDGKMDEKTICFLIWRFKFLRNEPTNQNKLINLYLKGDVLVSEMGWMNEEEIRSLLKGKKILTNDRYLISANKSIASILSRLKQRNVDKSNSKHKKELINLIKHFESYLEGK